MIKPINVLPGFDLWPGLLDPKAQNDLAAPGAGGVRGRAARPLRDRLRQGHERGHDQLRPAGLDQRQGRLSLCRPPSGHRPALAGHAPGPAGPLGGPGRSADAAGLGPDQSLSRRRPHGPAPGPRRGRSALSGAVDLAGRHRGVPDRRDLAQGPDAVAEAVVRRRLPAVRTRAAGVPRRGPDPGGVVGAGAGGRADQHHAAAGGCGQALPLWGRSVAPRSGGG
jgi:hypothetical protein